MSQQKTAKDVCVEFATTTGIHGIPWVYQSKGVIRKTIWTMMTLGFFIMMLFSIAILGAKFKSLPKSTAVSLNYSQSLKFPAVTVCNLNPVLKQKIKQSNDSQWSSVKDALQESDTSSDQWSYNDWWNPNSSYYDASTQSSQGSSPSASTSAPASSAPPSAPSSAATSGPWSGGDTTSYYSDNSTQYYDGSSQYQTYAVSTEFKVKMKFMALFNDMPVETKLNTGHTLENMMLGCEFSGRVCGKSHFTQSSNPVYGNCYTFRAHNKVQEDELVVRDIGPMHGLSITLFAQQDQYLMELTESAGWMVQVHDPSKMPLPHEEGVVISPGSLTQIGVTMDVFTRTPPPYGTCRTISDEENRRLNGYLHIMPNISYSAKACRKTCIQSLIMLTCECMDPTYPPVNGTMFMEPKFATNDQYFKSCLLKNVTDPYAPGSLNCARNALIHNKLAETPDEGSDFCDSDVCPSECRETVYRTSVTSARWPADRAMDQLMKRLKGNPYYRTTHDTMMNMSNEEDKRMYSWSNFGKVQIFFQELRTDMINTSPSYTGFQLMSDIGGVISLWIGLSAIPIFEVLEFLFNLLMLKCQKRTAKVNVSDPDIKSVTTVA